MSSWRKEFLITKVYLKININIRVHKDKEVGSFLLVEVTLLSFRFLFLAEGFCLRKVKPYAEARGN